MLVVELEDMMETENPDMIAISETWLTLEVYHNEDRSLGYLFCMADRLNSRWWCYPVHGNHPNHTVCRCSGRSIKNMWTDVVKCGGQNIVITVVYHSPKCVIDDFLLSQLKFWSNMCKSLIESNFNALSANWGNSEVALIKTSFDYAVH